MDFKYLNLTVNILIFLIVSSISIFFIFRLKNVNKGYKIFFISYILFWIPLKLLRDYTSVIQNDIDKTIVWLPLMIYGLVGIFIRPLADFLSLRLKNRKLILYMAIVLGIITFIPIIIHQSTVTNTIQSIGVGIGASMIGTYELMFKEQYTKKASFLTVSIMAFPPLIADFVSAPIQSTIKLISIDNQSSSNWNYLAILWCIGIAFYIITFLVLYFTKEDRSLVGIIQQKSIEEKEPKSLTFFVLLCIVGFFVSFLKFSNSGSIATLTIGNLGKDYDKVVITNLQAYISTVFSLFQLFGTVFLASFLIKKTNKLVAFSTGILIWVIYQLIISFNNNPYVYFALSAANGFAYGILYNLVLAYVLTLSFKKNKIAPMGVYQSILSIGITISSFLISYLKTTLTTLENANMIINLSLIAGMFILQTSFFFVYRLDKKIFIENKKMA